MSTSKITAEGTFKADFEMELDVPPGGVCQSINVTVTAEPADGGCLIYGLDADGVTECVDVRGGSKNVTLPFAHPKIWIKLFSGTSKVTIQTRGWQDSLK